MKTNILLAIRNIYRNKINSAITAVGLSVAFACLLLIYLYVSQEFSYNDFHSNKDRIFRANYALKMFDGSTNHQNYYDPQLSEMLKTEIPAIKRISAFRSAHGPALRFENEYFQEETYIAEHDFFEMFSFNLIIGNKDQIFSGPDEIVITSSLADKLRAVKSCSLEELIGQPVYFMNTGDQPFRITGIMEEIPKNSSMQFDALIPYYYQDSFRQSNNRFGNSIIFYEVSENADVQATNDLVNTTIKDLYGRVLEQLKSQKNLVNSPDAFTPYSLSIKDVYLSKAGSDYEGNNSKSSLFVIIAIGILILSIAAINFILLTLGQSLKKVDEMDVRKALGAKKWNIFSLFLTENIVLSFVAVLIGAILSFLLLPVFNQLTQREIYTDLISISGVTTFTVAVVLLIVILISIIPVLKIGKIKPYQPKTISTGSRSRTTSVFIVMQYCLSIFLIILTITIVRQTNYMKYRSLGFSSDNIINLSIYHLAEGEKKVFKDRLSNYAGIANFTLTDRNYISGSSTENVINDRGETVSTRILRIDQNYISTLGLDIIQGENFEEQGNKNAVIVNEKLLSHFKFDNGPIGETININGEEHQIIGIVKDYHFDSMKDDIEPLVFFSNAGAMNNCHFAFIKYQPSQLKNVISFVEATWSKTAPGKELDFSFWDQQLNERYQSEERWSKIIGYSAAIAIILSSMGLFGLTLTMLDRRIKEIGIRKVNGAKTPEILTLLNKDFVKWVVIAFAIATPIAWYAMKKWLENFAYKTELSWWIFALAGLLALGIALLTVSWQGWKAATRNPVEALRHE